MKSKMMYRMIREYLLAKFPLRHSMTLDAVMNFGFINDILGEPFREWKLVTAPGCCHGLQKAGAPCGCFFYNRKGKGVVHELFMGKSVKDYAFEYDDMINYLDENGFVILSHHGCQVLNKLVDVKHYPDHF